MLAPPRNQSRPCTRLRTARPAISKRSRLRSGTPTAHERNALPLHPSGPGGIRRGSLRGAQPSTPSREAHSTRTALEREFNPAIADCGLQGTATSPSSTAHRCRSSIRVQLLRWRPRSHAQRTLSTPRVRPSGAASHLGPSRQPARSISSRADSPTLGRRSPAQAPRDAKFNGGGGGIRTHGTVARTRHFQCRTFGHSATPPTQCKSISSRVDCPTLGRRSPAQAPPGAKFNGGGERI